MNGNGNGEKANTPKLFSSPTRLLVFTASSIFVAEAIVMLMLSDFMQTLPKLTEAMLDGFVLTVIILPLLYIFFYRPLSAHMAERVKVEESREKLIGELKAALEKIKVLSGLLPVCAACKRIRDDGGGWVSMEKYISERSNAQFTHSICDICAEKLYGLEGIDSKAGTGTGG